MAQTQSQQVSQQSFSPAASSPSPGASSPAAPASASGAPPPKRQRLSPLPQSAHQSPYASPHMNTIQLPHAPSPANGAAPVNGSAAATTTMPPVSGTPGAAPSGHPPPGSMGPPSRPVDKPTDAADLTDVLASSGIDVREEEAYLSQGYGNQQQQQQQQQNQPPRLQTTFNTSFTSQASAPSTISAGNSFSDQQQYRPSPTQFASPAPAVKSAEAIAEDEKAKKDTAAARRDQYALQSPFLFTQLIEDKIRKRAYDLGVRVPSQGLYRPLGAIGNAPLEVTGPDGSSRIQSGKTLLTHDSAMGDVISLITLGCEERLRSVIDHSATLAKNRRAHSHGVVPIEWSDLAVTASPPGGNSPNTLPQKRSRSPDVGAANDRKSATPIPLTLKSRKLIEKELSHEEERASKRAKRNADAILGGGDRSRAGSVGASTPATPTAGSERAPDPDTKKTSKKELKKQESKVTEAVQHQQSVETARMATANLTGGTMFGGKKKTYSWLTGGTPTAGRSGFSTPNRPAPGAAAASTPMTAGGKGASGGAAGASGQNVTGRQQLGDWREDAKGRAEGIQIRDILFMLEVDGRGVKHMQKAYSRESKEELDRNGR